MRPKPQRSIRAKLQLLAAASAVLAVGIAAAGFVGNDVRMFAAEKRQQLHTYACLVGLQAKPHLVADDAVAAQELLACLRMEPTITAACLYDARGAILAEYHRDARSDAAFPEATIGAWLRECAGPDGVADDDGGELELFQNLHDSRGLLGSVYLRSTYDDVRQKTASYAEVAGAVILAAIVVSVMLGFRLQRSFTGPIDDLAAAANRVTTEGDYSVRVKTTAGSCFAELCGAFNAMLDRIQASDRAIQEAHDRLNQRVHERTRDLRREVFERRQAEAIASGQCRVLQQLATGRPLEDVLRAIVTELESWLPGTQVAISRIEEDRARLAKPVAVALSAGTTRGLDGAAISISGPAPSRAAATGEVEHDRADAASGAAACWALPIVAGDGRLLAVLSVYRRNGRALAEDELATLDATVSLASVAIEQRRADAALTEAMQKATSANRAKSEFLANMSHEIRTPLNAILGFADLMLQDPQGIAPEHREHLETIATSGRHLLTLINDVLDLSKIEAGQVDVQRVACDPHRILVEVMSLLRVRATEKGISLECEWETPTPDRIETDPVRLRQTLVNLLGNAIKFTDEGGVRVVAAIDGPPQHAMLRVEVIDTGVGIAPDKLEDVFQPFIQADSSVTRRHGGTGLGLAISRRLARSLGGSLTVESEPGSGSRFTLRVAAGAVRASSGDSRPICEIVRPAEPPSTHQAALAGLRALVVDDGETNRRLLSLLLRRAGVEVELAENGQEAVEAVAAAPFDIVLMDMQMPVLDGYTAASRMRSAGVTTPIVALTAHAMKGDAEKCLAAGCTAYLPKPIEASELHRTIASLCRAEVEARARGRRPALESPPLPEGPIATSLPIEDDPELRAAVEQYLVECGATLREMLALAEEQDWAELRRKAHWLKGSGGTAGYGALTQLATQLERTLEPPAPLADAALEQTEQILALHSRLVVSSEAPIEALVV